MHIKIELNDINGNPINEGDRVIAYAQEYAEVSRYEMGDIPVIEEDHTKPRPIKDVPLFIGMVA